MRRGWYDCGFDCNLRSQVFHRGCIVGVAFPITETAPGHCQTGPDQKTAAERSETGDGLTDESERLASVQRAHPGAQFPPGAVVDVGLPFHDVGGGAIERELRALERMKGVGPLNRSGDRPVAARREAQHDHHPTGHLLFGPRQ